MNAKQSAIPPYADILVEFERMRTDHKMRSQTPTYAFCHAQLPRDGTLRLGPVLAAAVALGLVVCALVVVGLDSSPGELTDALSSKEKYSLSEETKSNTEALMRSRAWWEGYGRRHLQARRGASLSGMEY